MMAVIDNQDMIFEIPVCRLAILMSGRVCKHFLSCSEVAVMLHLFYFCNTLYTGSESKHSRVQISFLHFLIEHELSTHDMSPKVIRFGSSVNHGGKILLSSVDKQETIP